MLDFIWFPYFLSIQASVLSLFVGFILSNKGVITIYNNLFFKELKILKIPIQLNYSCILNCKIKNKTSSIYILLNYIVIIFLLF